MTIEELLIKHEDIKLKPYRDIVEKLTLGIGRNIEDNGISKDEALYMLRNDIKRCTKELKEIFDNYENLPKNVIMALTDMIFNLGKPRFLKFKKMIKAIREEDFIAARKQAKDSFWCKQVGGRCEDDIKLLGV